MLLICCTRKLHQEMELETGKLAEPVEKPTEALAEESSDAVTLSLF
ncbi:MAG TPA: hypothetical protein V6C65_22415 [Allocoleopsis sp.]